MNYGVLLAGGMGTRLGLSTPKQFLQLGDKTLLEHSVEKFVVCPDIKHTVVVVPEAWHDQSQEIVNKLGLENISLCLGGHSRQESLFKGVSYLNERFEIDTKDIAVSHDVARPFITTDMIYQSIKVCQEFGAADTVVPSADTIVESINGKSISNVPVRQNMFLGQTPQTFFIKQFIAIYMKLSDEYLSKVTDAARILNDHGVNVGLVPGDISNLKITTLFDLKIANAILNQYVKKD